MVQISEVKGTANKFHCFNLFSDVACTGTVTENRVAAHSHVRGLGLREDGTADRNAAGFIGQAPATSTGSRLPQTTALSLS